MKFSQILLVVALMILSSCSWEKKAQDQNIIQVSQDKVIIAPQAKFLEHIEIITLGAHEVRRVAFQSVGKMIALSNASNELTGPKTTWAELDPETTKEARLNLKPESEGTAYGVTSVPIDLLKQIRIGHTLRIKHYRVEEDGWQASVVHIVPTADPATEDIVFRIPKGHDLYPGTNCEVKFPLLQTQAVSVPATALLHEGLDEYVWQEVAPNEFVAKKVTLAEGSSDEVILSSGISARSRIIGRGAILLKPEIKAILAYREEAKHAQKIDRRLP